MKLKDIFWCVFWLVAGILIGTILSNVCGQISFLRWMTVGQSVSFTPAADLAIIKFSLDVVFRLDLAQVTGVLIGMLCYRNFRF